MSADLVSRLRLIPRSVSTAGKEGIHCAVGLWCHEAADAIDASRAGPFDKRSGADMTAEPPVREVAEKIALSILAVGRTNACGIITPDRKTISCTDFVAAALLAARRAGAEDMREKIIADDWVNCHLPVKIEEHIRALPLPGDA